MVADVRFKVRMRLRALIDRLVTEISDSPDARRELAMAQLSDVRAKAVKAKYRSRVVVEFPGCSIGFTHQRIYITLPAGYPASNVPVTLPYPKVLRGAFFPVPTTRAFD